MKYDFSRISIHPAAAVVPTLERPGTVAPNLVVGQVNDPLEHETDRRADEVMADRYIWALPAHHRTSGASQDRQID